jgi:transcription initiation factor TFIIIB Brf1 subunit/transcription initiation factor TFIIB
MTDVTPNTSPVQGDDPTKCPNCDSEILEYIGTHVSDYDPPEYTNEWWCHNCDIVIDDRLKQEPECLHCFDTKRTILGVDDMGMAYYETCSHCRTDAALDAQRSGEAGDHE